MGYSSGRASLLAGPGGDRSPAAGRPWDGHGRLAPIPLLTVASPALLDDDLLREDGLPLAEVAKELGVSAERVRQIEKAALRKCRRFCERHNYRFAELISGGRPDP